MALLCFRSIIFGPPGNTKGPLLFFLISVLLWGYPMYVFKVGCVLQLQPHITESFERTPVRTVFTVTIQYISNVG